MKIAIVSVVITILLWIEIVASKSDSYIISIRRSEDDKQYDKETQEIKNAINTLVNDRMNDIYLIMYKNKNTYTENGKIDEKLNEFETIDFTDFLAGKKKFDFVDKNRPENNSNRTYNKDIIYVKQESKVLSHICPISNYYTIRAYLSEEIVDQIKQLPNVINCEKSIKLSHYKSPGNKINSHSNSHIDELKK